MALSDRISHAEVEDEVEDLAVAEYPPAPAYQLARLVLAAALSRRAKQLLSSDNGVIIVHAPDRHFAEEFRNVLHDINHDLSVHVVTTRKKSGSSFGPDGVEPLKYLARRRSVVFITQDPDSLLDPEVRAAADVVVEVPAPGLRTVREAIRLVAGGVARGLKPDDIAGLGLIDLAGAIRIGSTPADCVRRLRHAALARRLPMAPSTAPPVEELPLGEKVEAWARSTVELMRRVTAGDLSTQQLRFAVLEGPPGTGKTLLAAALARSARWTFAPTSIGQWFVPGSGDLGDVVRTAGAFFERVAAAEGGIVAFIDEIDSLPDRGRIDADRASWWTTVITFVLTQIDLLRRSGRPILLLGATNHVERLDPALVRPGRLETRVSMLLPDRGERKSLFRHYLPELDEGAIDLVARLSSGATPARVEAFAARARNAAAAEQRPVTLQDLLNLLVPNAGRSAEQLRAVCVHESGHAVVALELGLPIVEVSSLRAGSSEGWISTDVRDRLWTREDIEAVGTTLLAGRAADVLLGSGANAGAKSDLEAANALLSDAMLEFGLYGTLLTRSTVDRRNFGSDGTSLSRSLAIELDRLSARASEIVARRRDDVLRLADALAVERVIPGERAVELLSSSGAPPPSTAGENREATAATLEE